MTKHVHITCTLHLSPLRVSCWRAHGAADSSFQCYRPPRLKTLLPTQAKRNICASASLSSLPLKLDGLAIIGRGVVLSPGEVLWNPLHLNLSPCFISAYSLATQETTCYLLSLCFCRSFNVFLSLSFSLSRCMCVCFSTLILSLWHNGWGVSLYDGN